VGGGSEGSGGRRQILEQMMATEQRRLPYQGWRSRLRQVIAQHPVAFFLIMVYAINIAVALPPALTRRDLLPFDQAPYDWLGHILGSAVPAFVVTWALSGRAGVRDLAGRCLRWRVGLRWYAVALLAMPVGTFLLASVFYGTQPIGLLVQKWTLLFTTVIPHLLLIILFSNVAEEIGWTGFFLDRMQKRFNPLRAAVITAVPFALFHVPGYVVEEGVATAPILLGVLFIPQLASRFVVAWLYKSTNRSVLLVGIFHCAFNVTGAAFSHELIPGPDEDVFVFTSGIVMIAAVIVAIVTKGRFAYESRPSDRLARSTDS
jgi:membrane protease YdiL (CAAX protease family)